MRKLYKESIVKQERRLSDQLLHLYVGHTGWHEKVNNLMKYD